MSSPVSIDPDGARRAALAAAYREACLVELDALKPGNVHRHGESAGAAHGMTVTDFEQSAEASAGPLTAPGSPIGRRILAATRASWDRVGCNTNLGIVLLAAPLLAAGEQAAPTGLRDSVSRALERLTVADAADAYEAIRIARPAGLGSALEEDVARPPSVDLRAAMALAAGRDRIARQYAAAYEDVFEIGVARLAAARRQGADRVWAASHAYLAFLAAFPDSHVARKYGSPVAEEVRAEAARVLAALPAAQNLARGSEALLDFDRALKSRGINPGTSADLTVASLLAAAIADIVAPAVKLNHREEPTMSLGRRTNGKDQ
jgi:triphosphoribosyl-dephospho-CoA synthase